MNTETTAAEPIGTATYSPEDNKLRLYPFARLPRELYDRVKAHGFSWAPKQELFVAPMWTPDRADLLEELCGEIGDEDKGLAERAEERAERFEIYEDSRRADASQARDAVKAIADHIPFGQPILVGHHSEKRARKDAERIENGMRRAVKMWETADYWSRRAAGAVRHAKYKERPDVRARRIKGIEADERKAQRICANHEAALRFWRGEMKLKNLGTGESFTLAITEENRAQIHKIMGGALGNTAGDFYVTREGSVSGGWSPWDVLKPDGERYQACPAKTVEECRLAAERSFTDRIARQKRWLDHYANRLAYERAMLAADGGTATDKTGPEVGGAVRCWASPRGGWSWIKKVNRVSVSVWDNWGNDSDKDGTRNFVRNVPLDKISGVMSKAQVDAARAEGTLRETPDKVGFYVVGGSKPTPAPEESEEQQAVRERREFEQTHRAELDAASFGRKYDELGMTDKDRVYLAVKFPTNQANYSPTPPKEDTVCPDGAACPDPECIAERQKQGLPVEAVGTDIEGMKATLRSGGVKVFAVPQLFPTPNDVARRMVDLADIQPGQRILEPSAGLGAILGAMGCRMFAEPGNKPYKERDQLHAVEINAELAKRLRADFPLTDVRCADFMSLNGELGTFDRILMNPPFQNGADIRHILHARAKLKPGGMLVAICANGPRQAKELEPLADLWEPLPDDTFAEQGTNVRTVLLTIRA